MLYMHPLSLPVCRYPLIQKCWRPAEARPLASEVLQLLMVLREDLKGSGKKRAVTPPPLTTSPSQQQRVGPTAATLPTSKSHDHFTGPPVSQHTKKVKTTGLHERGRHNEARQGLKRKAHSSEHLDQSGPSEEEGAKSTADQLNEVTKSNLRSSSSERSLTEKRVSFKDFATEDEDDPPQVVYSEHVAALIW